jgi:hypothetical protein
MFVAYEKMKRNLMNNAFILRIFPFTQTSRIKPYRLLVGKTNNFCETRSKRSVEVYKGKKLDPPPPPPPTDVTDITMETSQTVTDIIN